MGRVPLRRRAAVRLTGILAGALVFGFLFATSMMGAFRAPSLHDVPVAVVGPSSVVTQIQAALDQQVPGAFQLTPYPSVTLARHAIMDRHVDAAFGLPTADPGTPGSGKPRAQVIVASAISPLMAQTISTAFTHVAAAMGAGVAVQDIAPLPAGDPAGVSPFFFAIVLLLPSFIGGVLITFATRRTAIALKMAGAVTFAACLAAVDVAVVDGLLGALTGHAAELFGVGALTSLAFTASVVALGRVLGAPGIGLAALIFFVAGLPASGGPAGLPFLPAFYRFIGAGLPPANAVTAARNVSYFGGHAISVPLGVLAAWAGGGLAVLAAVMATEHLRPPVRAGARSRGIKHAVPRVQAAPVTSAFPEPRPRAAAAHAEPRPRAAAAHAGATGRTTAPSGSAAEFGGIVRTPDGSPLPSGAITVITTTGQQVARTGLDTAGRYRAAVPGPGSYTVIVTAAEYQPAVAVVTVNGPGAGPAAAADFTMKPSGTVQVHGVVRDAASGQPLPGATVVASNAAGAVVGHARCDDVGHYRITGLAPGAYTLTATGYDPARIMVDLPDRTDRDVILTLGVNDS
jgi:hypothetical protein